MKFFLFSLLIFLPLLLTAQADFETRYFKIDATSLPDVEELPSFTLKSAPTLFDKKLPTFDITTNNYWQPVTMEEVVSQKEFSATNQIENKNFEAPRFFERKEKKTFSVTTQYETEGSTRVRNEVYKPYGGLDYISRYNNFNPYRNRAVLEIRINGEN